MIDGILITTIYKNLLVTDAKLSSVLSFLRFPISNESATLAREILGDSSAVELYEELVAKFLDARPTLPFQRIDAASFRKALPGTGFPQTLFRKIRTSPDLFLTTRINYWHDQALDCCSKLGNSRTILQQELFPLFISFFGLHEHIFWNIMGVTQFKLENRTATSYLEKTSKDAAFLRWFSGFLTQSAEDALAIKILRLANVSLVDIANNRAQIFNLTKEQLNSITSLILDSCYSLSDRFNCILNNDVDLKKARSFVDWLGILILWDFIYENKYLSISDPLIASLNLSLQEIPNFLTLEKNCIGMDAVVEFNANGTALRLKHSLMPTYLASVTRNFVMPNLSISSIGRWFESEYLPRYIERDVDKEHYKVHSGFKPKQTDVIRGYDIDIIIEDVRRNKFFFIQIKYQAKNFLPYLADELETIFMKNDGIKKGIHQLQSIRWNFFDKKVRQRINSSVGKSLSDHTIQHDCHLILLHNLNSFDIAEIDGIPLYNWNLFRNFLKGGMRATEIQEEFSIGRAIKYDYPLPLESALKSAKEVAKKINGCYETSNSIEHSWECFQSVGVILTSPTNSSLRAKISLA